MTNRISTLLPNMSSEQMADTTRDLPHIDEEIYPRMITPLGKGDVL